MTPSDAHNEEKIEDKSKNILDLFMTLNYWSRCDTEKYYLKIWGFIRKDVSWKVSYDCASTRIIEIPQCTLMLITFGIRYLAQGLFLPPANDVCEGYVFTGVCLSTGGGCVLLHAGIQPPPRPEAHTPHPPCPVHAGIRLTSGRYASHWNAFLF